MRWQCWEAKRIDEAKSVDSVETMILLARNEDGDHCFIKGLRGAVHGLFLEGCLYWPRYIPWGEEQVSLIKDALHQHLVFDDEGMGLISESLLMGTCIADEISDTRSICVSDLGVGIPPVLIKGVTDHLVFFSADGKDFLSTGGSGIEKKELMFLGAEVLFGKDAAADLRNCIYGVQTVICVDEMELHIDVSEIMRGLLKSFRANNAVPGMIVLTPQMWRVLEESRARSGGDASCPN